MVNMEKSNGYKQEHMNIVMKNYNYKIIIELVWNINKQMYFYFKSLLLVSFWNETTDFCTHLVKVI